MFRSRKLGIGLTATVAVLTGLVALPAAAEADSCTISVTLVGGQALSFTVDVPAGTPLSSINLPVTGTVISVSESCASDATTATTTTSTTTPSTTTTAAGTTTAELSTPTSLVGVPTDTGTTSSPVSSAATVGSTTTTGATTTSTGLTVTSPLKVTLQKQSSTTTTGTTTSVNTTPTTQLTEADGAPAETNPTFSLATLGSAKVGVPNFFIDEFQIPPFLLPIYQAAGIEYNVPWQVLAAINWIETDYGRDLSVSSAGAVGWMQFLPSTFAKWGVDATGTGYADPYNPTDAIFTAARYLAAAGASKNLSKAIFAYNHANWYVQSVLLRAQLIGGMPSDLVSALTNLVEGHFPVAATATYADDSVVKEANKKVSGTNAAITVESTSAKSTEIFAKTGSPVIAVNDGKIVSIGHTAALGNFVKLQDSDGNVYTYSHLGSIPKLYAVPKPVSTSKAELAQEVAGTKAGSGNASATSTSTTASAGLQPGATVTTGTTTVLTATKTKHGTKKSTEALTTANVHRAEGAKTTAGVSSKVAKSAAKVDTTTTATATTTTSTQASVKSVSKERLFANPTRPASYAAGGEEQLAESSTISSFKDYFSDVLHLAKNQYTLAPLTKGSVVVAGTILGRVGPATGSQSAHMQFQIQPGGSSSTYIDPKPVLDGWKLLEATAIYRANGLDAFLSSSKQATIGQILLESKSQLQESVLSDRRISIYACGRRDVQDGAIDRRILAVMEYLAESGLDPTVSGLKCGAGTTTGIDTAGQTGASMDISAINGIPVAGHDGTGSVTDITIRRLLTLQGAMSPDEIISGLSYKGQSNTLALPDHRNRIQVTFTPEFGTDSKLTDEVKSVLKPNQWIQLISHIGEIPEPSVPTARSEYAVKTAAK